jgi:hypothetical protein
VGVVSEQSKKHRESKREFVPLQKNPPLPLGKGKGIKGIGFKN